MNGMSLCEIANCGKPAIVFGLNGTAKLRSCEGHIPSLLAKASTILRIERYSYISRSEDIAEFEERKALVEKGRGNLTALEAACESELAEALHAIEATKISAVRSVEDRFAEMKAAATAISNETKEHLEELRGELSQLLTAKDYQFSPSAQLICTELSANPRFLRLELADVSDRVSAVLSDSWGVATADFHSKLKCLGDNQNPAVIESALAEAAEYAKKGFQGALLYVDSVTEEEEHRHKVAKEQVITELLKFEGKRIEENLKWLQRSWDLRQRYQISDSTTARIGQQLANFICYQYNQFTPAEEILRKCYEIEQVQSPLSELSMSLCTDMCRVYSASAQHDKLEELGGWIFQTFATAGYSAEHYWVVIFYLIDSMQSRAKKREADALFELWREFQVGNKLGEMMQLLTCAIYAFCNGNNSDAEKCYREALHIGMRHFPTSFFTALICSQKACMFNENENSREQLLSRAKSILQVVFPKSVPAANNLNSMGLLFANTQRLGDAEECFLRAKSIYDAISPNSLPAGDSLSNLGTLYNNMQRLCEAEECYRQATLVYDTTAPGSISAANNLSNMGALFAKTQRLEEAKKCFREAKSIFEVVFSQSVPAANNLNNMGAMFAFSQKWDKSEKYYRQAMLIYEVVAPKSVQAANNLNNMAALFCHSKKLSEAEECFRKAKNIYDVIAPKSVEAAGNLGFMGSVYEAMQRLPEAIDCYQKAVIIFALNGKSDLLLLAATDADRCRSSQML